jgi:hypothetical protein
LISGIRVADNGAGWNRHALPFATLNVALLHHVFQLLFQVRDAIAHDPAILFELGFTFATQRSLPR